MTSAIRKIELKNAKRNGLNSKGKTPGPAQTPPARSGNGGRGLRMLSKSHDLKSADKECRNCHGKGAIDTQYAQGGKSRQLACSCVSLVSK